MAKHFPVTRDKKSKINSHTAIRLYRTAAILDWRHVLLTPMRGHVCKVNSRRSRRRGNHLQSCPTDITDACGNVKIIALKISKSYLSPISEWWSHSKALGCQNTARRGQKCPGKLVRLSMSLSRTCIYINYYDLVHLQITNSTRVCSVHFKEADFQTTLTWKRVLEKHAVPSIFCWSRSPRKSENHRVHKWDSLM